MHRHLHAPPKHAVSTIIQISVMQLNAVAGMPHPAFPVATYGNVFTQFNRTVHHLGPSTPNAGGGPNYRPVAMNAADPDPALNFIWLPYHPGQVTLVPYQPDVSILTGWMSGCWLALVRVNGVEYFAHLGTDSNAHHPNTLAVKNMFKLAVGTHALTVISAFQPISQSTNTIGCISPNRNLYTIGLSPVPGGTGFAKSRIDSKTRIQPSASLPPGY